MNTPTATAGLSRLEVRATPRPSFTEYHVTATIEGPAFVGAAAAELFDRVAALLAEHKIQPIQEKVYGLTRVRDEVLKVRDSAYQRHGLDRSMPVSWLQGTPLQGCDFVGLQIWGVVPTDGASCVETVTTPGSGRGRLWRGHGFQMLHLAAVRGTTPAGPLADGHVAQAEQMFTNIGLGLAALDFQYTQVARTWIYMARLLEWYDDLNRVRTAHFRRVGIGGEGGVPFPASTGIQCHSDTEECVVDVLAVAPRRPGRAHRRPGALQPAPGPIVQLRLGLLARHDPRPRGQTHHPHLRHGEHQHRRRQHPHRRRRKPEPGDDDEHRRHPRATRRQPAQHHLGHAVLQRPRRLGGLVPGHPAAPDPVLSESRRAGRCLPPQPARRDGSRGCDLGASLTGYWSLMTGHRSPWPAH